jgi:hypothetical protein
MAGVNELRARGEQWAQEGKGATAGSGRELWLKDGDKALCWFLWTGADGDPYFETYLAHEVPSKVAGQFAKKVYCPVESGFDLNYPCRYCVDGLKTKPMMAMWLHVTDVFHRSIREGEQLSVVQYQGQNLYHRPINAPRIFNTSAWRESPKDAIFENAAALGNMHALPFQLSCVGTGTATRYRLTAMVGYPPFDPQQYAKDVAECEPIVQWLTEGLKTVAVATAPVLAGPAAPAFQMAGAAPAPAPVFAPPPSAPVPSVALTPPPQAAPVTFAPAPMGAPPAMPVPAAPPAFTPPPAASAAYPLAAPQQVQEAPVPQQQYAPPPPAFAPPPVDVPPGAGKRLF